MVSKRENYLYVNKPLMDKWDYFMAQYKQGKISRGLLKNLQDNIFVMDLEIHDRIYNKNKPKYTIIPILIH